MSKFKLGDRVIYTYIHPKYDFKILTIFNTYKIDYIGTHSLFDSKIGLKEDEFHFYPIECFTLDKRKHRIKLP